jgi:DUF1680 family protein
LLDQPGAPSLYDISLSLGANPGSAFQPEMRKDLLGGVVTLKHMGSMAGTPTNEQPLYDLFGKAAQRSGRQIAITLIPYYAWANRAPSQMQVWLPYVKKR